MSRDVMFVIQNDLQRTARKGMGIEQALFFLQLLGWGKLSLEGKLPGELSFLNLDLSKFSVYELLGKIREISELDGLTADVQEAFSLELDQKKIRLNEETFTLLTASIKNNAMDFSESAAAILQMPRSRRREVISLPEDLVNLMFMLSDTDADDTIYCPFDENFQLTYGLAQRGGDVFSENLFGKPQVISLLNILGDMQIQHQESDPINSPSWLENGVLKKFDVGVCAVPFGERNKKVMDLYNRNFPGRVLYSEIYAILHLIAQSKKKVVALVPNNLLQRSSAGELHFKENLLHDGQIETILSLPDDLFGRSNVSASLIIINPDGGCRTPLFVKGEKGLVDATNVDQLVDIIQNRREVAFVSCLADVSVCEENDFNLLVERYVLSEELTKMYSYLNNIETIELSSVATITRSQLTQPRNSIASRSLPFVTLRDFRDGGYISTASGEINIADRAPQHVVNRSLLQPFDILVVTKGTIGKVGLITPGLAEEKWLAGQMIHVIRMENNNAKMAYFVFMFLRSTIGQTLLNTLASGAGLQMIRPADLRKFQIPKPTEQDLETVKATFDEELRLIEEMKALQEKKDQLTERHWAVEE